MALQIPRRGGVPGGLILLLVVGFCYWCSFMRSVNAFGVGGYHHHSYRSDSSTAIQRFSEWLEAEECEGLEGTEIGYSPLGLRGVYAKEGFDTNEYIMAIPFVSCVKVFETIYDVENHENEASDVEKGGLLLEQMKSKPHWQPYFDVLPTLGSNFDATPDFWDDETIQQLEVPQLVQNTLALKREAGSSPDLQFATWLLRSRAFSTFKLLPDANEKRIRTRTVLIPYMDFLNHKEVHSSNAKMQKVEAKNDDESFFALVATRSIKPGDQITITYGTGLETSLDLFTKYGFWYDENPNDANLNLEHVSWSTSLEDDEELLSDLHHTNDKQQREMLALRAHLKRIEKDRKRLASE